MATYDYPYLRSNEEGLEFSRDVMLRYSRDEADSNRFKRYPNARIRIPLPVPNESLVDADVSSVWNRGRQRRVAERESVLRLVSMAFGKTFAAGVPWQGAPLMRRTSPSGGARHPTEGYLISVDVPGLASGWYHVASGTAELELLREGVDGNLSLRELFPNIFERAAFHVSAILILTSVFERNMYRYREPRTFRTVHMDAGHLAATVEILANAIGIGVFVQYAVPDEVGVETELGIDGLEEGFILAIGIG